MTMNNDKLEVSRDLLERITAPLNNCAESAAMLMLLEELRDLLAKPAAQHQGEPVAWKHTMYYEEGCGSSSVLTGSPKHPFGKPSIDYDSTFLVTSEPLYAEQSAQVTVDAAKAFAKGFNTLEQAGGKYRINMQFANRDDAWAAYGALGKLSNTINTK